MDTGNTVFAVIICVAVTAWGIWAAYVILDWDPRPSVRRKRQQNKLSVLEHDCFRRGVAATDDWIRQTDEKLEDIVLDRIEQRTGCRYVLLSTEAQRRMDAVVTHELEHIVQWTATGRRKIKER